MKSYTTLPEGYREIYALDMHEDKKLAVWVNLLSLAIAAVFAVPMLFVVPWWTTFDVTDGMSGYWVKFAAMLGLTLLYLVLHELVHGIAMRICGTKKIRYGFKGVYAFAASDDYYHKKPYVFIALAPVVLWGIVLAIVTPFVPASWFWVVYFVQLMNLSGAAGDLYVTVRFSRMPRDILIRDSGVQVVYGPEADVIKSDVNDAL